MSMITDHMEAIRELIPEQYKGSVKLNGLIAAVMHGCDDVETMLQELRGLWDISSMEGVNLDTIGRIIGVYRKPGESDTDYRQRLASGSIERELPTYGALRRVVADVTGSDRVGLYPVWPAGVYVVVETGGDSIRGKLDTWAPSGVDARLGTFLRCEDNGVDYILDEDNGQPFVIDQCYALHELTDGTGNDIVDENGDSLAVFDIAL